MNEHDLPPDELASAHLDDVLADSDAAAVRDDPALAARVEEFRRIAEAVGEPVTPPAGAADAAVETTLADYEARRVTDLAGVRQRRPRNVRLITGAAAAIAVGFLVAAAIGLFSDEVGDDAATVAQAPAAATAADAAPAPPSAAEPAAESPPAVELLAVPTTMVAPAPPPPATALPAPEIATVEGNEEALAAAGAALAEADEAADEARAEAASAQAEATEARAAAPAAQAEAASAQEAAAPAPAAPAAPAADDMDGMAADDMDGMDDADMGGPSMDIATDAPVELCPAEIGDGTAEVRFTLGEYHVVIVRTTDGRLVPLDADACEEIPTEADDAEAGTELCPAEIGDGTVELRFTLGGHHIVAVHTADGRLVPFDADACEEIPADR